jgi:hypothetical protein
MAGLGYFVSEWFRRFRFFVGPFSFLVAVLSGHELSSSCGDRLMIQAQFDRRRNGMIFSDQRKSASAVFCRNPR